MRSRLVGLVALLGAVALFTGGVVLFLWYVAPVGIFVALLLLAPLWVFLVREAARAAAYERCELAVREPSVSMGGVAHLELVVIPARALPVTAGTLSLITRESAEYRAGTDSRTYVDEVLRWSTPIDVPARLEGTFTRELLVPIPRDCPPTLELQRNSIRTICKVHLELPGYPDAVAEAEVHVAPELVVLAEPVRTEEVARG